MKNHGFARILLATDGSEPAKAAEAVVASFGRPARSAVRVVHVWNMEVHPDHGHWDLETHSEAETLITDSIKRLRASGLDADGELCHADTDHVASAIAASATRFGADLVVVGARGLSDWQSLIKHSVSHQLLTTVDCPLLVVRGNPGESEPAAKRVLVAIAGGADIAPAVHAAVAAASNPGSRVLVIHVAQLVYGAQFAYVEPDDEITMTIKTATEMLQAAGVETEAFVAGSGHVANVLRETASQWDADVIVIGSSRTGDLASIAFGSVTHELLRGTGRPVLVAERARS